MQILGIETSCDETAAAVYDTKHGLLSNRIHSQISIHQAYGGVVPELASRDHIKQLHKIVKQAIQDAGTCPEQLQAIAYTAGPGLIGALLVGASFAHGFAYSLKVPVIPVHHMEGHLLAALLTGQTHKPLDQVINHVEFPFIALLVSGGHTQLYKVQAIGTYQLLGESLDDAAGEAFDKTAKLLSLSYPGGPAIAAFATQGNAEAYKFPRPMLQSGNLNFSFSGLKTSVLVTVEKLKKQHALTEAQKSDIAASFQAAVVDTLYAKCRKALKEYHCNHLVIAGGVSANFRLRSKLKALHKEQDIEITFPETDLCTDNAAMIAFVGAVHSQDRPLQKIQIDPEVFARPRWPLSETNGHPVSRLIK